MSTSCRKPPPSRRSRSAWTTSAPDGLTGTPAPVRPLTAEDLRQGLAEGLFWAAGEGHRAPADVLVGTDQEHAVFVDLADPRPVVVDIGVLAARADDHRVDGDVELVAYFLGGCRPRLASDTGDQRERGVRGEVEGGDLVRGVADPHVRQVRAGDGGGLVIKLRVPRWLRPFRSIRNDRG